MSSHHFVREGQEPALYIHDAVSSAHVASLLEWAPLVITRASQLESVISWGIKVDVVILDVDDNTIDALLSTQFPVRKVSISSASGLEESALAVLQQETQRHVTIVAEDAHSVVRDWRVTTGFDSVTVLDSCCRWLAVSNCVFSKWVPEKTVLLLFPARGEYTIQGASYVDDHLVSAVDGLVSVHSPEFFWVGEWL